MAGNDRTIINTDERFASGDANQLQDLAARQVSEALGRLGAPFDGGTAQGCPGVSLRPSNSGGSLAINAGVLVQQRPGGVGAPGTNDSETLLGIYDGGTITLPTPGVDTWYLIEAQVVENTDPNIGVDIFDSGTQTFVNTPSPKRTRFQVNLQLQAGTATDLPGSVTANWEPIGGLFRPGGGGALTDDDVIDLRERVPAERTRTALGRFESNAWTMDELTGIDSTQNISVHSMVTHPRGRNYFRPAPGTLLDFFDPLDALVLDPTAPAVAASDWRYLYLASWPIGGRDVAPRNFYRMKLGTASVIDHEGLFIVTDVAPRSDGSRMNSAQIDCPAPFNAVAIPADSACCIGMIRRDSALAQWEPVFCEGNYVTFDGGQNVSTSFQLAFGALPQGPTAAADIPGGAHAVDIRISPSSATGTAATVTGTSVGTQGVNVAKELRIPGSWLGDGFMRHFPTLDPPVAITFAETGGPLGTNVDFRLIGAYI